MAITLIAKKASAGNLTLDNLSAPNGYIPGAGQVTLTDYNTVDQIQSDPQLLSYIVAGTVILNDGTSDLTQAQSQNILNPVVTSQTNLRNVTNDAQLKRSANDFNTFTLKSTPVSTDILLLEDSAASGAKKYTTISGIAGSTNIFGQNYTDSGTPAARTTTTSSTFQDKLIFTTPAVTGTYLVIWSAVVDCEYDNHDVAVQLYNNTNSVVLGVLQRYRCTDPAERFSAGAFIPITMTGTTKSLRIQLQSPNNYSTVGIADARIVFWRVS
jgi:hypothetical protein